MQLLLELGVLDQVPWAAQGPRLRQPPRLQQPVRQPCLPMPPERCLAHPPRLHLNLLSACCQQQAGWSALECQAAPRQSPQMLPLHLWQSMETISRQRCTASSQAPQGHAVAHGGGLLHMGAPHLP